MSVPLLTCFPAGITSGDTVRLQLSFGDYPATIWAATLRLNQAGGKTVSITGTSSGDSFLFTITAAVTAKMAVGQWTWAVRVTSGGDVATARAGDFSVLADYSAAVQKTITQQQLDAANAQLLILNGNPDATVSFNGQTFTKANVTELMDVISRLEQKLERELAAAAGLRGDPKTRSIRPYFV